MGIGIGIQRKRPRICRRSGMGRWRIRRPSIRTEAQKGPEGIRIGIRSPNQCTGRRFYTDSRRIRRFPTGKGVQCGPGGIRKRIPSVCRRIWRRKDTDSTRIRYDRLRNSDPSLPQGRYKCNCPTNICNINLSGSQKTIFSSIYISLYFNIHEN